MPGHHACLMAFSTLHCLASCLIYTIIRTLYPSSPSPYSLPCFILSEQTQHKQTVVFMSSTGQATSSTSNIQLIIDALADYAKTTGIELSQNPFAASLEQSNSPDAILQLLQRREAAFKDYRDENRRLISCLGPAVRVLRAFSGILGEAVNLVSPTYHSCSWHSNMTPSGPLSTSERFVCWDRCSPCCTFLEYVPLN
jgi:hypothetical protein